MTHDCDVAGTRYVDGEKAEHLALVALEDAERARNQGHNVRADHLLAKAQVYATLAVANS